MTEVIITLRLIRLPEVEKATGVKKSIIYKWIKEGSFPCPVKAGRSSLWRSDELDIWLNSRPRADLQEAANG